MFVMQGFIVKKKQVVRVVVGHISGQVRSAKRKKQTERPVPRITQACVFLEGVWRKRPQQEALEEVLNISVRRNISVMKKTLSAFIVSTFLLPATTFAATTQLPNPLGTSSVQEFIGNLIKAALGISGSIALAVFVYGGFLFLLSAADAKNVQKGKDAMLYGVVGLAIIFGSYAIVNFVINALLGATNK